MWRRAAMILFSHIKTWTAGLDDDHYDLGTRRHINFIRKLDLYGLTLPQLHLSYV